MNELEVYREVPNPIQGIIHITLDFSFENMSIEKKYQKLDEISHVLARPGRYIGSVVPHTAKTFVVEDDKFVEQEITWSPGLLKIFDEIVSNSVDFSKTPEGKHVTTIKVDVDQMTGAISVEDDGGIPVVKHKDHDQWIPEMIFELRAGSNFNDDEDSMVTGQNGEGSALTAIFSSTFEVMTDDGKKRFFQVRSNNNRELSDPKINKSVKAGTRITFYPELTRFNIETIDDGNLARIKKRVYDVAGCNPRLNVFFNGKKIKIANFTDYVKLYVDVAVSDSNSAWRVAVCENKFEKNHVSFVNGTETHIGGTHLNFVTGQVCSKLQEYIRKKHKIEVRPGEIRNHLMFFVDVDIVRPRYSSQSKEDLITEMRSFGTEYWNPSDKFIANVIKAGLIQPVLDWVAAKEAAAKAAELRKLNSKIDKSNLRKIAKFTDATSKDRANCMLFVCEGLSASNSILSARTPLVGCYPLKGKPLSALGSTDKQVIENQELLDLMTVMGLKIGVKVNSIDELRFGKLVLTCDADFDGAHIAGLLVSFIRKYWPELLSMGCVYQFITPIVRATQGKASTNFYDQKAFKEWSAKQTKPFTSKYYKGLGTSTAKDFATYFGNMEEHLIQVTCDGEADIGVVDLVFGKEAGSADRRKVWLDLL